MHPKWGIFGIKSMSWVLLIINDSGLFITHRVSVLVACNVLNGTRFNPKFLSSWRGLNKNACLYLRVGVAI